MLFATESDAPVLELHAQCRTEQGRSVEIVTGDIVTVTILN